MFCVGLRLRGSRSFARCGEIPHLSTSPLLNAYVERLADAFRSLALGTGSLWFTRMSEVESSDVLALGKHVVRTVWKVSGSKV